MKTYPTMILSTPQDLQWCPLFAVDNYQWICRQRPVTEGRMGYLPGQGLLLRMTCYEHNPKRLLRNHREMVCTDSAMEAFFAFPDRPLAPGEVPPDDGLYLNLEVNANGAMYAKHGRGRHGREFLTDAEYWATGVRAWVDEDRWSMELLLPQSLLRRLAGIRELREGDAFYCNFYKISEDPAIEHYVSYSAIGVERPNFHLPRFFAQAMITR